MDDAVRKILEEVGAFHQGHFVLTSGAHSSYYINAGALLAEPLAMQSVALYMREQYLSPKIDFVVCPAEAAIPLCTLIVSECNRRLDVPQEILALYASKVEGVKGEFEFKRGQGDLVRNRRGIVFDDLGTSGRSVKKVVDLTRANGGEVIAVHYLVIRGQEVTPESVGGVPELWAPLVLNLPDYPAEDCPLCANGEPINTDLGHGASYVAEHGQPVK